MGDLFGLFFVLIFYGVLAYSTIQYMLFGLMVYLIERAVYLIIDGFRYLTNRFWHGRRNNT